MITTSNKPAIINRILSLMLIGLTTFTARANAPIPNDSSGTISQFIHHDKIALKIDYFGELALHPGLTFGFDRNLLDKEYIAIHWDMDMGGFWHRWNNTSFMVKSTIGSRFYAGEAFADINAGIGYMHSFAAGTIYQRGQNGEAEKANNKGTSHFIPNASFLLGYDATRNERPYTVHFGPEVYIQSSFNHIYLPHLAVKVGLTYKIQ